MFADGAAGRFNLKQSAKRLLLLIRYINENKG
jgi:hypothetical protein